MRPRICELFDTASAREYTLLDEAIKKDWVEKKDELKPVKIPKGIRHPTCYLCNERMAEAHWFYHKLCYQCGEFSYQKRNLTKDLTGKKAIVTGGRVKLGYQVALKLLRAGASVAITSRNWENALVRYQDEPDYETWKDRLHVCRVSFDLLRIDELLGDLDRELNRIWPDGHSIDIIIHNAAQTICDVAEAPFPVQELTAPFPVQEPVTGKRKREDEEFVSNKSAKNDEKSKKRRRYPPIDWVENVFPEVDRYQRKVDQREINSWSTKFGQVGMQEAKQVLIANAWAPFVLNQFLLPRLINGGYIIHVHAKEGHFNSHKNLCHTHTNMAKAALCMMTRCLAKPSTTYSDRRQYQEDWAKDLPWTDRYRKLPVTENVDYRNNSHNMTKELHVHGVDPGWFSVDEYTIETRIKKNLFFSVIDEIDAASRVVYPIFMEAPSFPGTWRHYVPLINF